MKETWLKIEKILNDQFPVVLLDFNSPCSVEDLEFLKDVTNNKLKDMYELYEMHDGQKSYDLAFSSPWRLLSVQHIKKNIKIMNEDLVVEWAEDDIYPSDEAETRGPVKSMLWNINWIPMASNGVGDLLCIDLDPDTHGKVGQIIVWWHETVLREVLFSSLSELMLEYLYDLQAGIYDLINNKGLLKV